MDLSERILPPKVLLPNNQWRRAFLWQTTLWSFRQPGPFSPAAQRLSTSGDMLNQAGISDKRQDCRGSRSSA